MNDYQAREVEWYRQHGKFPERIGTDIDGQPYVIGDADWNSVTRPDERIEARMFVDLGRAE